MVQQYCRNLICAVPAAFWSRANRKQNKKEANFIKKRAVSRLIRRPVLTVRGALRGLTAMPNMDLELGQVGGGSDVGTVLRSMNVMQAAKENKEELDK